MTSKQLEFIIEFFRNSGLDARVQEGEIWVKTGDSVIIIEEAAIIPFFGGTK